MLTPPSGPRSMSMEALLPGRMPKSKSAPRFSDVSLFEEVLCEGGFLTDVGGFVLLLPVLGCFLADLGWDLTGRGWLLIGTGWIVGTGWILTGTGWDLTGRGWAAGDLLVLTPLLTPTGPTR